MNKIRIFLLVFYFLISYRDCLNHTDFCNGNLTDEKSLKCFGKFSFTCGGLLCSRDEKSCQQIDAFNSITSFRKISEKAFINYKNKLMAFLMLIKDCPEYKWSENDVCLNTKDCFKISVISVWSIQMKLNECNCMGKFNFKCNSDYCATDKRLCDQLKIFKKSSIKKC